MLNKSSPHFLTLSRSARLGVHQTKKELRNRFKQEEIFIPSNLVNTTALFRGKRNYELSNHLGNVQMVISDKRKSVCDEELGVEYFVAEVLSAVDYYPFWKLSITEHEILNHFSLRNPERSVSEVSGMLPDRQWYTSNDTSQFVNGFNGMRYDHEINQKGRSVDYGARILDVDLGRWLSVDPLMAKYSHLTPFSFAGDCPILLIDPDGKRIVVSSYDQYNFMEDMSRVFGKKEAEALFSFNENNELVINNVKLRNDDKKTVLAGLQEIAKQEEITRLVYVGSDGRAYDPNTRSYIGNVLDHGGEITTTIADRPNLRSENTVFVYGFGAPTGGEIQTIIFSIITKPEGKFETSIKTIRADIEPRAANVLHGLGHVLYPKEEDQYKVIDFDNAGRRSMNATSGMNSISEREYDDKHNKPDDSNK